MWAGFASIGEEYCRLGLEDLWSESSALAPYCRYGVLTRLLGTHTEAVQLVCHLLYAGENLSQRSPCVSSAVDERGEQRVEKALARVVRAVDFYRVYRSGSLEVVTELYEHMSVVMSLRP